MRVLQSPLEAATAQDTLQEGCRLLAYHHAGRHRVAGRDTRQNGSIGNTESLHAVDLQFAIDDRHGIAAHSCGTRLMPEGAEPVAKKTLELPRLERTRGYLAPRERSQSRGVPNLASNAQAGQEILEVLWIREV